MGFYFMTTKTKKKTTNYQKPSQRHSVPQFLPLHTFPRIFAFFTLLFSIMLLQHGARAGIILNKFGVKEIKAGDTALVFYANASHNGDGDSQISARLHMERCCMFLPPNKTSNCDIMKLTSGLGIVFHPKDTHILQMYFLNFDLYDREGFCDLRLLTRTATKPPTHTNQNQSPWEQGPIFSIAFLTVLPKPNLFKKLLISLGGSSSGYRICNADNYNALHECSNYDDCLTRYAGGMSLFNKDLKKCELTPGCENSSTNFLSVVTRKCERSHDIENVRKSFTPEMKIVNPTTVSDAIPTSDHPHHLSSLMVVKRKPTITEKSIMVCEHGFHVIGKNGKPNCTCHQGWRSLSLEEWQQKGGIMPNNDEGLPLHHMCTVPLIDQRTRGFLIIGFAVICLLVPCVAMLMISEGKKKRDLERRKSRVQKLLAEESSSEDDKDDEEKVMAKKTNTQELHEMEEEEAEKVISEIANRREPQLPKTPSKKDDDNDDPPQPPPSPSSSPATSGAASQASQQQQDNMPPASRSTLMIPSNSSQTSQSSRPLPPAPPPSAAQSNLTTSQPPSPPPGPTPPSSKPSAGTISINHKLRYTPSGGFDYKLWEDENDNEDEGTNFPEVNSVVATQTQSTDDLLSMNIHEKRGAHIPMNPKTGNRKGLSVVVANCAVVELNNDQNVTLRSLSSEEITQQKKEEWAEFIKSVSKETLYLRPGHCSISLEGRKGETEVEDDDDDEDDGGENGERNRASQCTDFSYFNKDHKPKAIKVRSVPGMMQYHPFSASSSTTREELPEPPPQFIQKAFGDMQPEELASRQECYRVLNSLSNERLSSTKEGGLKGTNSIWSNIASENTKEPSTTPGTTTEGSRMVSSCEDGVGDNANFVRTSTIYGDMGSDADSDGALEQMVAGSSRDHKSNLYHQDLQRRTNEHFHEASNRTVYGFPPNTTPSPVVESPQGGQSIRMDDNNAVVNLVLDSDLIPSDAYATDSAESFRIAHPAGSSIDFWKSIATFSLGGNDESQRGANNVSTSDSPDVSFETTSAYKIKSSLETALKASRSRSGTNLF